MLPKPTCTLLAMALLGLFAGALAATSGNFTDGAGANSDWTDDANWSGATHPGSAASEIATFDGTAPIVNVPTAPANPVTVELNGGDGTIDLADSVTFSLTDLTFTTANALALSNTAAGGAVFQLAGLSTAAGGSITVGANVTLQISGAANFSNLTVTNNGIIEFDSTSGSFAVTGAGQLAGALSFTGGNTVTLDADPGATGLTIAGSTVLSFTASVNLAGVTVNNGGLIDFDTVIGVMAVTGGGQLAGDVRITAAANGITFDVLSAGSLTAAVGATASVTGATTLTGTLSKSSTGSLALNGVADIDGNVTVTAGDLTLGDGALLAGHDHRLHRRRDDRHRQRVI